MTLKDFWVKTRSWMQAHRLFWVADYQPQLDNEGLISPETKLPDESEINELDALLPELSVRQGDTWLIRLAQDCSIKDLPIKDLTRAIAGELVFSLWIRRRDAHFSNRALVDGFGVGGYISGAKPIDFTADLHEVEGKPVAKRGRLPGITANPRLKRVM